MTTTRTVSLVMLRYRAFYAWANVAAHPITEVLERFNLSRTDISQVSAELTEAERAALNNALDDMTNAAKALSANPKTRKAVTKHNAALLTLDEVAEELRVSRRYVENLITVQQGSQTPRLRTVRQGRLVFVTRTDLDAYVVRLRLEARIPIAKR